LIEAKQGGRFADPAVPKMADTMPVMATAKRRRPETRLDKRFKPKMSEKHPPGAKNTCLGKIPKKYRRRRDQQYISRSA
jgi:hypothetical protein